MNKIKFIKRGIVYVPLQVTLATGAIIEIYVNEELLNTGDAVEVYTFEELKNLDGDLRVIYSKDN